MLEIKTITENTAYFFDKAVNEALADGWELVRRECFITGADRATTLYAELERNIDEDDDLEGFEFDATKWEITRDPLHPYRCAACNFKAINPVLICPNCKREMINGE